MGVTPLIAPIGRYPNWDFCHVKTRRIRAPKSDQTSQGTDCSELSPGLSPNPSDLGPGFGKATGGSRCSRRQKQFAASRQRKKASRARYMARCVTVTGKLGLPELALLLSARSLVSPATFLTFSKNWREMRNARFTLLYMALGCLLQAPKETLTSKSGLPELAHLLSA